MEVEELLKRYAAGERDFTGVNLCEVNLSRVNLSGCNLSHANLSIANLSGANLSGANLTGTKLNVTRLSGANLSKAKLNSAILNVANLVRANLSEAELIQASLIRAELIRAELSRANLIEANLNAADLRESKLRQANLAGANLSEADLRGASLAGANLEQAKLNQTDLTGADLSGANLSNTELRHVNFNRANLSGADLSGANLRWAALSGANLQWANLSDAKLSGANLIGADLSNSNLLNASLVHADLTQANLIRAEWVGADLSGATLTGAKLYGVSRFGLKTDSMICEWVDVSPHGDHTVIYRFNPEDSKKFFNQTPPTVRIVIDAPLDQEANFALANAYHQIALQYPGLSQPPSITVGYRRTVLTFRVDSDEQLFPTAYVAILPFENAAATQRNIITLIKQIRAHATTHLSIPELRRIQHLSTVLGQTLNQVNAVDLSKIFPATVEKASFFYSPTHTILLNSSDQSLSAYHDPSFGKRFMNSANSMNAKAAGSQGTYQQFAVPPVSAVVDFIRGFYSIDSQ